MGQVFACQLVARKEAYLPMSLLRKILAGLSALALFLAVSACVPSTGGTSGGSYLKRMLEVELFPELWQVRTAL